MTRHVPRRAFSWARVLAESRDGPYFYTGKHEVMVMNSLPPRGRCIIDADAEIVAGHAPPSARVPLSRMRIINAAIAYIDDAGLAGLTMRQLGQNLGVEAMSLYRYVPSKEDLLDGVVEALVTEMQLDARVPLTPESGWQDFLQRQAHGIRRVSLLHPKAFPLVASRPVQAPWLRPPLRSLEWVEVFLSGLRAESFDAAAAVAAYRAFTSFLLGHLLLEVAIHGADIGPLDVIEDTEVYDSSIRDYPNVNELRSELSQDKAGDEFEEALESLLDRLNLMRQH